MTDRDRQLSRREFIQQIAMVGAGIMLTDSSQLFAKNK